MPVMPLAVFASLISLSLASAVLPEINNGLGAQITPAPELFRRQASAVATCGFVTGDANRPVTCSPGRLCASTSTYVGCCTASACQILTSCISAGSPCDNSCSQNLALLSCGSTAPYCATYNYGNTRVGYGCAIYTSYSQYVLQSATNSPATVQSPTSISTSPTSMTNASPTTPDVPVITTTVEPSPSATQAPASSGLSGGAIAGIVIGAILGVAILAGLFWFIGRKSASRREANNQPPPPMQNVPAPAPMHMPMPPSDPKPPMNSQGMVPELHSPPLEADGGHWGQKGGEAPPAFSHVPPGQTAFELPANVSLGPERRY